MQSLPSPLLSGPSYNRCQVRGVAYRPRAYNGPGDPSGIVLFGFPIEQVGYLFLRPAIHNLVCRHFVPRIDPHVLRLQLEIRKNPRGLIKLHARTSQVGQDPVPPVNPQLVHDLRNPRERRLHQRRPLPKGLQPFPGQLQRLCVPVQADQSPGKAPWSRPRDQLLRDGRRVPAGSQRCVHVRSVRLYAQPFEHLIQHHRRMWRTQVLTAPLPIRAPTAPPKSVVTSLHLCFVTSVLKSPNLPAPCRRRSCTARSSSYPPRAYGSLPRDNPSSRTHPLRPSSAPIRATPREPRLCPARRAQPFARNSSCASRIFAWRGFAKTLSRACPRFPTKLSSDRSALIRLLDS